MANKPASNKVDPATLAFSAVENALKDSILSPESEPLNRAAPGGNQASSNGSDRSRAASRIAKQTGSIANDDNLAPSRLLYGLNAKPSQAPIWIATVLAIGWFAITGFATLSRFGEQLAAGQSVRALAGSLEFAAAISLVLLPILGFFAVAILARRAADLRIAATSMTRAAIRLAEPETTAADKIATVGQAVRREVSTLADGLERALSRAGELEVMIHNEVTVLDKTYSENESRMRGLIQELASQRDSVITNSERVREAISESHSGLVFDLDMIAQRIAGTIEERGGELTRSMNTASDGLQKAFGERTDSFISLVDGRTTSLLSALDDSAGQLNLALEDRTSSISNAFEERTHELASVIDMRMNAITEALDTRAVSLNDAIEERTASISSVLRDGGGKILTDLRDRGHEVGGALDAIGLRVANEISGRAGEAEVTMNQLIDRMDEMVSVQINAMESRMQSAMLEISGSVDEASEQARIALLSAGAQTLAQFDTRVEEVSVVIDTRLQSFDGIISEKGDALTSSLDGYTTNFANRANVLELALDEKTGHFNDLISQRAREMAETVTDRAEMISRTITDQASEIVTAMDGGNSTIVKTLDDRRQKLAQTLDGTASDISKAIGTRTQELAGTIQRHGTEARDSIETSLKNVTETMDARSSDVTNLIDRRVLEVNESLGRGVESAISRINDAESGISARVEEAASTVNKSAALTADLIEAGVNSARTAITDMVDKRLGTLPEAITARAETAASRLAELNEAVNSTLGTTMVELESSAGRIESSIGTTLNKSITDLETTASRVNEAVSSTLGTTLVELEASAGRIETSIDTTLSQSMTNLETTASRVNDAVSSTLGATMAEFETSAGRIESSIGATVDKSITDLETTASRVNEAVNSTLGTSMVELEASAGRIENSIGTSVNKSMTDLEATATRVETSIGSTLGQTLTEMEATATRVEETINSRLTAVATSLSTDVENSAGRMDSAVRDAMEKIVQVSSQFETLVRVDATESATALGEKVDNINRTVTEKTGQFAALIADKADELTNNLRGHGNILSEALQANASEAKTIMSESTSAMMTDVSAALQKLNESNTILQQVLDASTHNLATLENNVANQTASYSTTVRDALAGTEQAGQLVSDHVGAMQITIRSMIEEFSTMVGKLDGETANVDRAAQSLSEAGKASLDSVEARREAMDALAVGFIARADEVDLRLRSFAQSIADTVNDTEGRLSVARKAMEEALNSTTESVTDKLESLAKTAGVHGEQTSAALTQSQEAILAEMQRALADATQRFNDTAQSMQDTAQQVSTELESTRSELQRGFLELPEETRTSAAAMRSVVAEQIEALSELNAIVRAQPASHDISGAAVAPPAPQRSAKPLASLAPAPIAPAPVAPAPIAPVVPPTPSAAPTATLATRPAPASISSLAPSRPAKTNPAPTAVSTPAAAQAPVTSASTPAKDERSGWLSDVLRNASTASAQTQTSSLAPRSNHLTRLTADIARSIDENALSEAWQRYQAGETGTFSRRIYTLTGQGTYDEVRKKLQRDPEFAKITSDYVTEFEQLLQTAKDINETRQMLNSERGKVFTMLAHASGRIS